MDSDTNFTLFVDATPHHTTAPIFLVLHYPLLHCMTRAIVAPIVSFPEIMHGNICWQNMRFVYK
jgi:hypothetical protein